MSHYGLLALSLGYLAIFFFFVALRDERRYHARRDGSDGFHGDEAKSPDGGYSTITRGQ